MRAIVALVSLAISQLAWAQPCPFNASSLSYDGSDVEQARCLLRPVKVHAHLGAKLPALPSVIESHLGNKVDISIGKMREFLASKGIKESDVGGNVENGVSEAVSGGKQYKAAYFVIHDTSTPNYKGLQFPGDINAATWKYNDLKPFAAGDRSLAHVFVNRVGESIAAQDFKNGWRATKFEMGYSDMFPGAQKTAIRGRFIHIELVQPRRSLTLEGKGDALAPDPGFTDKQYDRLAVLYIVASVRAGKWLVPGYHAVIDATRPGAHDDPQNFSIDRFAKYLEAHLTEISN